MTPVRLFPFGYGGKKKKSAKRGTAGLFKWNKAPPAKIPELETVQWRHEWKYELSAANAAAIRSRLQAVMRPDPHSGPDGVYRIRSLYFDNCANQALLEKLDGADPREKFRIRYYNGDLSFIHLEKKYKRNGLGTKFVESVEEKTVWEILKGPCDWSPQMPENGRHTDSLLLELHSKMRIQGLRPRIIVDYAREAYLFEAGNVRVTFDYDLRVGLNPDDFLNPAYEPFPASFPLCFTDDSLRVSRGLKEAMDPEYETFSAAAGLLPAGYPPLLMEVKWDRFLPGVIQDVIQTPGLPAQAFSKYAQCRSFG